MLAIPPPPPPVHVVSGPAVAATAPAPLPPPASTNAYSPDFTGDWGGWRAKLAHQGLSFWGALVNDSSWNFMGGKSTDQAVNRSRLTLGMTANMDTLFGLPGGQINAGMRFHFGPNGNDIQAGSIQGFSFVDDNPPPAQLYELYYLQKWMGDKLALRVGRMDANNIFDIPADADDFINPSATNAPLAFQNSYPFQAPGLVGFIHLTGDTEWIGGVFYNDRFHPTALDSLLNTLEPTGQSVGTSLNMEVDQSYCITPAMPGLIGLGGFWRTGQLPTLNDSTQSGTGGAWAFIDQTLWQYPDNSHRVAIFANFTANDPHVSLIDYSFQAGLLTAGMIPGRHDDKIGLGVDYAHLSPAGGTPHPYELVTECFYECYLGRGMTLQPDLQYFNRTGGGAYPDALIALLRLSVNF